MSDLWYRRADGALTHASTEPGDPELPKGATVLTEAQYDTALASWQAEKVARQEAEVADTAKVRQSDAAALVKLGLSQAAADRIVGVPALVKRG